LAYYGTGRAVSTCTTTHVEVTYGGVAVAPMARGTGHRADTALRTVVPGMARTTKNIVGKKVPKKIQSLWTWKLEEVGSRT
jgi:hypothetical protein